MTRYVRIQRVLHWLMALIVTAVLAGGLMIGILGFEGVTDLLGRAGRDILYEYHKTFGLIVLALMFLRLFVRVEYGKPKYDPPIKAWERAASAGVQYLLYLALFAMPILGWLATDASDYPVEFLAWNLPQFIAKDKAMGDALYEAHGVVGWTIAALLVLHVGGALKHALSGRKDVIDRIWPLR